VAAGPDHVQGPCHLSRRAESTLGNSQN
jgi:hypothetical protein